MRIGVETYSIRKQQKKDLQKSCLSMIESGILDFEFVRIKFNDQNAKILKTLKDQYGLNVCGILAKPKEVFFQAEQLISFCHQTGCTNIVISMLPFEVILGNEAKFYQWINQLDQQAELYRRHGIELAFHHHDWEYAFLSNGKTRMDELLEKTNQLKFVLDTYWLSVCGRNVVDELHRFHDRLLGLHIKDVTLVQKGLRVKMKNTIIGTGILDFESILHEAEKEKCAYAVIELNTDHPVLDVKQSFLHCQTIMKKRKE